jgi:hypothetical protein
MNADDLGSPRELTGLQRRRALYQPELPPCLVQVCGLPDSHFLVSTPSASAILHDGSIKKILHDGNPLPTISGL